MKIFLEIDIPDMPDTERLREDLRLEVDVQIGIWAERFGAVEVEIIEDPSEQVNRSYDAGYDEAIRQAGIA
jgi:hypothetical protein